MDNSTEHNFERAVQRLPKTTKEYKKCKITIAF